MHFNIKFRRINLWMLFGSQTRRGFYIFVPIESCDFDFDAKDAGLVVALITFPRCMFICQDEDVEIN